jgi:hypothetical protein
MPRLIETHAAVRISVPAMRGSTPVSESKKSNNQKLRLWYATLLAVAITSLPTTIRAQDTIPVAEELQQARTLNEAKRQATIGANVEFTREESSLFWPLFWQYRTEVNRVDDQYTEFLEAFSDNFDSMGDRKARTLTDTWLAIELERYELKKEFIGKFNEVLPAVKTMRIAQIENKLDMMLALALTKRVPLLPAPE